MMPLLGLDILLGTLCTFQIVLLLHAIHRANCFLLGVQIWADDIQWRVARLFLSASFVSIVIKKVTSAFQAIKIIFGSEDVSMDKDKEIEFLVSFVAWHIIKA